MKTTRPNPTVFLETLEPRIAPASLTGIDYKAITLGSPQLIHAGEGLSTSDESGSLILAIEKGQALVFTTDLNGNNRFDSNEITGISAGDGLRMTSFADINGDIVTNLRSDGTLSDSDGNAANGRDGLLLLNSKIEGITMRSVTEADLADSDPVSSRIILSHYSINGNIYAGAGVGAAGAGIVVDTSGLSAQISKFSGGNLDRQSLDVTPNIGGVKTGSAASEQTFHFGYYTDATAAALAGKHVGDSTVGGTLKPFVPAIGQTGGDIIDLKVGDGAASSDPAVTYSQTPFTIGFLIAGDGGIGARGGNIENIALMGDTGGLIIAAGKGGDGINGGNGGSITNLSDAGSVNSIVQIKAGDGGEGFLGNAGAAGTITLGTFKTNGHIYMGLGSGGDALVNAGSGTSLVSGVLEPTGTGSTPEPVDVLSTWRPDDAISYSTDGFDFNNDGVQDLLYVTDSPDQLAVKFGLPASGIRSWSPTVFFNAPNFVTPDINSTGITVADFNADGLLDIAVVSSAQDASDGLRVFLNDGTWFTRALAADTGGNYVESFVHSQLPYLPAPPDPFSVGRYDLKRGPSTITDLVSGDFNGDGVTDLAYMQQGLTNSAEPKNTTSLVVLEGSGDGHFFANFQYDRTTDTRLGNPVYTIGNSGWSEFLVKSTVTTEGDSATSRIVLAKVGDEKFDVVTYSASPSVELDVSPLSSGSYRASWWDHKDPTKLPADTSPAIIQDFTILDVADGGVHDGFFDIVALNTGNALTTFQGDAAGKLTFKQGVAIVGDNTLLGKEDAGSLFSITSADFDGDPSTSEIAVLIDDPNPAGWSFKKIGIDGLDIFTQDGKDPATSPAALSVLPGTVSALSPSKGAYAPYDVIFDESSSKNSFVSAGLFPDEKVPYFQTPTGIFVVNDNELTLRAGDGGDSYLGNGGNGGGFGSGGVTSTGDSLSASLKVINPADRNAQTSVQFFAADGGNGFLNGGRGGNISGLVAEFAEGTTLLTASTELYGGDGGWGLTGTGGSGGSLSGFFTKFGTRFESGDGGNGSAGGNGGDILANSAAAGRSTYTTWVDAMTGNGGDGIFTGGNGGRLSGFTPEMAAAASGGDAGGILYRTGSGGDAIAGRAGNGGEISGSSPLSSNNNTAGEVDISTGNGGDGQVGGKGGSLSNFSHLPTITSPALVISVLAGAGGSGISGNGGNGGSVSTFVGSATGISGADSQFNRVIAGDGGSSFGAVGGQGGALTSVTTTANSSASAIAAGQGGDGLLRGGNGGSISNSSADSSAGLAAKVIVIAGSGGNAFAALATAPGVGNAGDSVAVTNLRAFGTANGIGGDGGNITTFKQPKTVEASVDLIAGNGGGTPNYGNPATEKTGIGRGGSLSGITLTGEAGRVNSEVKIVSYEKGTGVGSIQEFVQVILRDTPLTQLTDAIGNVGVVVGQAGRVKGGLPGGDAGDKTGSVTNFTARSIMSMVAGSVDRIAAINTISGIHLTAPGGVLGAYKNTPVAHPSSDPLYYTQPDQGGATTAIAQIGGSLMDGAIVTQRNNSGLVGPRLFVQ